MSSPQPRINRAGRSGFEAVAKNRATVQLIWVNASFAGGSHAAEMLSRGRSVLKFDVNWVAVLAAAMLGMAGTLAAQEIPGSYWRYYRPSNTGIQGDLNEAIYIGADNDPWIGGYDPGFEEGGVAKLIQSENRWINVSNVDYPVIGHPDLTGTTRVSDIVSDTQGQLWMATWRGALVSHLLGSSSTFFLSRLKLSL